MSDRHFFNVSIGGYSTPKGCRKPRRFTERLTELPLDLTIDDEVVLMLTTLAKERIKPMSKVESCSIYINKAKEDDTMRFVALLPERTIKVL